jgi:dienelactone hydrolase
LLVAVAVGRAAGANSREVVAVPKAFDNTAFSYRMELKAERGACRVYRLSYPSPVSTAVEQNNTIPAELYLPRDLRPGTARRPAVICLHILDGNEELVQVSCLALAARGIPALWFNLPYYGPRGPAAGRHSLAADPVLFADAIAQAVADVRRTVDVLASRPEIDPQRIGVMGISLGGILAGTAAEQDTRIARAALILAGGDLLPVLYHASETREIGALIRHLPPERRTQVEQMIQAADPLRHADQLRGRALAGKVLMVNATEDQVIPRACTEKLAAALGIADRVVWLQGFNHYTAIAALPRTMQRTVDFFARDLPPGVKPAEGASGARSPERTIAALLQQCGDLLAGDLKEGRCHFVDLEVSATTPDGKKIDGRLRLVRGPKPKFRVDCQLPGLGEASLGYGAYPWMAAGQRIAFLGSGARVSPAGTDNPGGNGTNTADPLAHVEAKQLLKLQMLSGILGAVALAPDVLDRWLTITGESAADKGPAVRIVRKDRPQDSVDLILQEDRLTPRSAAFDVQGVRGTVAFHAWQFNTIAHEPMFQAAGNAPAKEVAPTDLTRMFSAALNFAAESLDKPPQAARGQGIRVVAKDPAGHGILCQSQGKTILIVAGTPAEMGAAQGTLLRDPIRKLCERVLYLVGGGDSLRSATWSFDRFAEIQRRTLPHIPERFLVECDALAKAAGMSQRDGRAANLFPERFHCSGVALRGKATADGKVLHARVLDYMRDIRLQDAATVTVFLPAGRNRWVNLGYAGFIGTVTAMNEKGLAVGEMGGRGEGEWDGMPMSLLLRDLMERAATVDEALEILRRTPRTCEYYYVLSDKSRAMAAVHCEARQMTILRPGQQHPRLPRVPEDTVLVSGPDRAKVLSRRLQEHYGKIDAAQLVEIIKRPVAMNSNLHDAILSPETLDLWIADAGRSTPACDEPYAHFNLQELLRVYQEVSAGTHPGAQR